MIRLMSPLFAIVLSLVIFLFFTRSMFADVKEMRVETAKYQDALDKAEMINEELQNKIAVKRGYSSVELERLNAIVPTDLNEVRALADLSARARVHRLLFGNVVLTEGNSSSGYFEDVDGAGLKYEDLQYRDIEFSIIGTYDQFKAFLNDLEQSLSFYEVVKVHTTGGDGQLQQFTVVVRIFALPNTI
jgi:hypothetical protein